MRTFEAVVFDMDGVVLDTEHYQHISWLAVAERKGLADVEELYFRSLGRTVEQISEDFEAKYGYDGYREFRQLCMENNYALAPDGYIPLREGTGRLLAFLKENGKKIALATSTEQEVASWQLRDAGALDYFDVMICGDMVVNSKPDPEIFLKACQGLGVRPADAFVVEDAFSGVRAAHAAGARTIMVPDQVQPTDEIAALAEVVLPSMDAAREYMAQFL